MTQNDYRNLLIEHFEAAKIRRKNYSLRAFARDLDLSPAQLSRLLRAKQHLSLSSARKIAEKLFSSPLEIERWLNSVEAAVAPSADLRERAAKRAKSQYSPQTALMIEADQFQVLADWFHFAILEAITLKPQPRNPRQISKLLGISPKEAEIATERLLRLGLITSTPEGYSRTHRHFDVSAGVEPSQAIQRHHHQMLSLAQNALKSQPLSDRYFVGQTLALTPTLVEQARDLIQDLERKLQQLSEEAQSQGQPLTELIQVQIQAFQLATQSRGVQKCLTHP